MSKKGCSGFFLFYLDIELLIKFKKQEFLQITQDLNKIKKNPAHPFLNIGK